MYGNNKVHYDNRVCIADFWYDEDEAYDNDEAIDDYGAYDDNKINGNDKNDDDDDLLLDTNETYRNDDGASKDPTKAKHPPQKPSLP
eukprot:7825787-Ditylum_brightwellii.AAC.1